MDNSEAWKRLNAMASSWVKGVEGGSGEGKLKLLGLDMGRDVVKGAESSLGPREIKATEGTRQAGSDMVIRAAVGQDPSEEDGMEGNQSLDKEKSQEKEGDGVMGEAVSKGSADLPGFDREQMNILKALLSGVERDSLVHVQGLSESRGKGKESWVDIVEKGEKEQGDKFTAVQDSVRMAKDRGVGKGNVSGGFVVPAGSYVVPGSYEIPDGEGGVKIVHFNAKGIPCEDDDPNRGYTSEECNPRLGPGQKVDTQKMVPSEVAKGCETGKAKSSSSGKSWASVASASQKSDVKMRYFPSSQREVVLPPIENVDKWNTCLVGYIFDRNLNFNYVKNSAFYMWKQKGLKDVTTSEEGFFIFKFDSKYNADCVFENGPYHIGGSWLVLKKWHRMLKLSKDQLEKIPIWIKLFNVPLEYWDEDGLSRIASAVGVPLFMDRATAQAKKLAYARVCVEIEPEIVMPERIKIRCGDDSMEVKVVYQWLPEVCIKCKTFGHKGDKCDKGKEIEVVENAQSTGEPDNKGENAETETEWEVVRRRKGKMIVGEGKELKEDVNMKADEGVTEKQEAKEGHRERGQGNEEVISNTAVISACGQGEGDRDSSKTQRESGDPGELGSKEEAIIRVDNQLEGSPTSNKGKKQKEGTGPGSDLEFGISPGSVIGIPEEEELVGEEIVELSPGSMTPIQEGKKTKGNKRSGGSHRGGKKR